MEEARCAICGEPCQGTEDSSNPFCPDCIRLNFLGNERESLSLRVVLREPASWPHRATRAGVFEQTRRRHL